jgi:UDP-N-acetylglucosamine 2-epimerase
MRILSIVGARPQFVKAAVVSKQIRASGVEEQLLHTGQHYDFNMSEVFFRELGLPEPSYYLGIGSGRHGEQTGKMLAAIEDVLLKEDPDAVLVYGDTNTTLAGALAPAKLHIPVAHVEAGLRSFNRQMPEEINRIVADRCADILFCPTRTAVANLENEGFQHILNEGRLIPGNGGCVSRTEKTSGSMEVVRGTHPTSSDARHEPRERNATDSTQFPLVANVGDVMLDIARQAKDLLDAEPQRRRDTLGRFGLKPREYILATIHRAANTDDPTRLRAILEAMRQLGEGGRKVLFPVHPRTRGSMERFDLLPTVDTGAVVLSDPVSYMEMIALESEARLLLTDSGGVQKEAYFFGVPCVVARDETEWTELVEIGWNRLAGSETTSIVGAAKAILAENFTNKPREDFYGDGNAAGRIASVLRWLR